ncbi:hypothetical protein Acr_22g0007690 [Actinidia rufa]|uniref:Uncharacterized protein n=1 Tax=Actinidia rufa TaxID=165716 RepID=A0A7J0GKV1_9ERIC|nr:hypothetical protein Acr_22g0007690 [Actinidia rufa]
MPPKFFKLTGKPANKKSKVPDPAALVPALVAPKLHSSPCPQKGKGKVADMGTSHKRRHGVDANSGELKKTKEYLIFESTTLIEERKTLAEVITIAMEEVTSARAEREKDWGELVEL